MLRNSKTTVWRYWPRPNYIINVSENQVNKDLFIIVKNPGQCNLIFLLKHVTSIFQQKRQIGKTLNVPTFQMLLCLHYCINLLKHNRDKYN